MDAILGNNMSEKQQVQQLIKSLQKGLKQYSLEEFNLALSGVLKNKAVNEKDKEKQIIIVLDSICKEYNITKDALVYEKTKRNVVQARNIAYCILHLDIKLSIRYIATRVFFLKWHNSVGVAIKNYNTLNPEIPPDKEFIDKFKKIQTEVIKKINI